MPVQLPKVFNVNRYKPTQPCDVEGCLERAFCKGMCNKHYNQVARNGHVIKRTNRDLNEIELFEDFALISIYNVKNEVVAKAIIDLEDVDKIKHYPWSKLSKLPYVYNSKLGMLHHVVMNTKELVDHRDTNPLNNRKDNLRLCTKLENNRNKSIASHNTSGAKGVSWNKLHSKYEAYITLHDKKNI